jgi:MFS family permease
MNINLGYNCVQFFFALVGASIVDKVGRRPLLLFSNIGCSLTWIGMTACTSQFALHGSPASAKASLAMIYIFGIVFSIGFTPLQALYPVEVLSFEMRAKGMAFSNFAVSAGKSSTLKLMNHYS